MFRNHPLIFMNYTDTYLILSTIINFLANFEIPQTLPFLMNMSYTMNGRWTDGQTKLHVNVLELTAITFALFSLLPLQVGITHLGVMTDNSTAISHMGQEKSDPFYVTM